MQEELTSSALELDPQNLLILSSNDDHVYVEDLNTAG